MKKNCEICNQVFEGKSLNVKRFCSKRCKFENSKQNYKTQNNYSTSIPSGTVGAISELHVCADLLSKGFYVFRAVSQCCICDLAILLDEKLFRIEVTTGFYTATGKVYHPKKGKVKDKYKYDILAIYMKDGKIIYEPELPT